MSKSIQQYLSSDDPKDRLEALKLIVKNPTPQWIEEVRYLAANDPDERLRNAAVQALNHLENPGGAGSTQSKKKIVSESDRIESEALMGQALELFIKGNQSSARKLVIQALDLNPNLPRDDYYGDLVVQIVPDYIGVISGANDSNPFTSDQPRATWREAWLDIGIYSVANAAVAAIFAFIGVGILLDVLPFLRPTADFNPQDLIKVLSATRGLITFGAILGTLVFATLSYLFQTGIYHLAATRALSGRGDWTNLIRGMLLPSLAQTFLSLVITLIAGYIVYNNLDFAYMMTLSPAQAEIYYNEAMSPMQLGNGISTLAGIGFAIWIAKIIGQIYGFGTGKGCLTMIIGYIGIFVVVFALGFCSFMMLVPMMAGAGT